MEFIEGRWLDLALFIGILLVISIVDIKTRKIPDLLVLGGFVIFFCTKIFLNKDLSFWLILDTAVGFLSIFCLWLLTKGGIGLGDAKLSALLGFLLGIYHWVIALLVASVTGLLVCAVLLILKKIERKQGIPFAPFLAIGGIVSYVLKYFIMKDIAGIWQNVIMYRN
jgi:leader peptidase (prepilin peptidase)/N-methyltransferase